MRIGIVQTIKSLWNVEPHERVKFMFISSTFFAIIAAYTVLKDLKDAIFTDIVGLDFINHAKGFMVFGMVPLVFLFSLLVDKFRRYQLLCFTAALYSFIGFLSAAVIYYGGVGSRVVEPYSLYWFFGWVYYFYVESFSPFVVSVFWAFLNSISTPDNAKKNYGLIVSCSKIGGMFTSGLAWWVLSCHRNISRDFSITETHLHCLLIVISSIILLSVPIIIWRMMRVVPGKYLHGYEVVYQFEKAQSKQDKDETGMFSGLCMLYKYPYILGIFGITFFYETINVVLGYLRLDIAFSSSGGCLSDASCYLFESRFISHTIGFVISILGTRLLTFYLGERFSLLVMPVTLGCLMIWYACSAAPSGALILVFGVFQAMHYAFEQPVIEALYIPTVKDIKFKSKSWIDTFGKRLARFTGSGFNIFIVRFATGFAGLAYTVFFTLVIGAWGGISYALGRKYDRVIKRKEIIGAEQVS